MKKLTTNPMDIRTKNFTETIKNVGKTYYKPIDLKLFDSLKRMAFFEITELNDSIYNIYPFKLDNYHLKMNIVSHKVDYIYCKNLYFLSDGNEIDDRRYSKKVKTLNLMTKTVMNDGGIYEFEIKKINNRQKVFYFKIYLFQYNDKFVFLTDDRRYSKKIKMKSLTIKH